MAQFTEDEYRTAAKHIHEDAGSIELDDNPSVSVSDPIPGIGEKGGAYVQAWVYVSDADVATSLLESGDL